jgi:hypothetical protein
MVALTAVVVWIAETVWAARLLLGATVPPIVIILAFYAVAGSLTSILMRLRKLDLSEEDDRPLVFMTGALQPVVAMGFMTATYVILSSSLLPLHLTSPNESESRSAVFAIYYVAAFLCGFSEQFAPSLLDRVGVQIGARKERCEYCGK